MRCARGAALVETALTLGFTLLLIVGALQVSLLGFFQMQLDGSTYFFAHNYAARSTDTTALNSALAPLFPGISVNITPTFGNPPTTNVPVNFIQWGSLTNRYGGASIARPQLVQASSTMTLNWLSALGKSVTISGGNVDERQMIGNHDDDAQGVGFDSGTAYSTLVDPLSQDDQNTPPYYFNLAFIWYCSDSPPWGSSCAQRDLRAVGLGEYLKDDNYKATVNGIGPNGVFATAACHQRILADLANAFPATMPTYTAGGNYDQANGPSSVAAWGNASFQTVYSWDVQPIHGESSGLVGTFYPMAVTNGCGAGQPGA